jgi:CRISPR-associated protein Cas1
MRLPLQLTSRGSLVRRRNCDSRRKARRSLSPFRRECLTNSSICPRLFYYEFVEGVFVENADTTRGAALHSRVDKGTGALPSAQIGKTDEPTTEAGSEKEDSEVTKAKTEIHSRSVTLGSERLGVIAKLDLVEMQESPDLLSRLEVCPVDYKAGAPREGEEANELWPTDRVQLGLQILILRDNGYRCDRGIIYYRTTKQRVPLEWTPELESWVLEQVESARKTTAGPIPPPLVGSPKCVRCSLNSVCLPDETWMLARGTVESSELDVSSRAPATTSLPMRRVERGEGRSDTTSINDLSAVAGREKEDEPINRHRSEAPHSSAR